MNFEGWKKLPRLARDLVTSSVRSVVAPLSGTAKISKKYLNLMQMIQITGYDIYRFNKAYLKNDRYIPNMMNSLNMFEDHIQQYKILYDKLQTFLRRNPSYIDAYNTALKDKQNRIFPPDKLEIIERLINKRKGVYGKKEKSGSGIFRIFPPTNSKFSRTSRLI